MVSTVKDSDKQQLNQSINKWKLLAHKCRFISIFYWKWHKYLDWVAEMLTALLTPPGFSVWGRGICWRGWWGCCCCFLVSVNTLDSVGLGSESCFCGTGLAFLTSWLWGWGPNIWPTWKYGYRRDWGEKWIAMEILIQTFLAICSCSTFHFLKHKNKQWFCINLFDFLFQFLVKKKSVNWNI